MSIISCPECHNKISDKAEICPHCGLPRHFFINSNEHNNSHNTSHEKSFGDYNKIKAVLVSFSDDWRSLFGANKYIARPEAKALFDKYSEYVTLLNNPIVSEYIRINYNLIGFSIGQVQKFLNLMSRFMHCVDEHNDNFIEDKLVSEKVYFNNILKTVDANIILDDEQRRAVVIDEDYCLIVAGAGAGKTTTMAAKVKYLVEKQGVSPSDIMVISYTNKAIDELRERILLQTLSFLPLK